MAKEDLLLLDFPLSPFCQRVKIALEEKGIAYKHQEENLFGGKSELLLKSNPIHQKVPVLLHDGKPICESTIIVQFIDETFPSPPLLPSSSYERSRARFWADFIDKKLFESGGSIWKAGGADELEAAKNEFFEVLKCVEGALSDKGYFGGDSFGFLDIIAIAMTNWFPAYEKFGNFKVEDKFPKLSAWIKRCSERISVAKSLADPQHVIGFVTQMRKMHGLE
ncbi:OLC1v1010319C1 [Oldenlandia corymbosa var. corymbosa]|uniref:glutathione transferase n=1 Tax=Oldenlandia corymbosa var. corymbosa TaxID=529605 RepID=A0AAV1DTF3_OLDCO|nr:OLC1v1010319C1 [Oldenlandia corymbosa var. corymbosa]